MSVQTVAIDASVLVAAACCPTGASARLLHLASLGIFKPVVAAEVLDDAEQLGRAGVAGRVLADGDWLALRMAIAEFIRPATPDFRVVSAEGALAAVLAAARAHGCQGACIGTTRDLDAADAVDGIQPLTPAQWLARLVPAE